MKNKPSKLKGIWRNDDIYIGPDNGKYDSCLV